MAHHFMTGKKQALLLYIETLYCLLLKCLTAGGALASFRWHLSRSATRSVCCGRGTALEKSTNLSLEPPIYRHTSGSMSELSKMAAGGDGGRIKRAIPIPTLFPDVGGVLSLNKEELC
jgi:hypothetical protein